MKQICYLLVLVILSCNSGMESDQTKSVSVLESEENTSLSASDLSVAVNLDNIAAQKLQEYADLLALEIQHPEFKEAVQERLMVFSENRLWDGMSSANMQIEDVTQLGSVQMVSDSVQKIRYSFTMVTDNARQKDTLIAVILSRKIALPEGEMMSYKITFEKEN